jgi:hypothetical protein
VDVPGWFWIVAWLVVVGWRFHELTRDCYEHVQEVIRADAHAGQQTIRAQERVAFPTRREAAREERSWRLRPADSHRGLYQPTAVTPHPHYTRYVWLLPHPLFLVAPVRRFLRGVVIHWTPMVRYPKSDWFVELTEAVAHFLGLPEDGVELAETNISRKRARIMRAV